MSANNAVQIRDGMTLRQAALAAGFCYLFTPTAYAEFSIWPRLIIPGNIEQTIQNLSAHPGLFVAAILCYFVSFALDVVIAWALYILLAPVNRGLSLLAAWFRIVYATIGFVALFSLFDVVRILDHSDFAAAFGASPLRAQIQLLLDSFHWNWSISLEVFGIHLVLLGFLIFRSVYIARWIGILLVINGLGWMISSLQPYLYPSAPLGWIFFTYFGELIFMLWLLIMGWRIQEPAPKP